MEGPIFIVVAIVASILLFDILAIGFGSDSRPLLPDDHRR